MNDVILILILFVATAGALIIPAVRGLHRREQKPSVGVVGPPTALGPTAS